MTNLVPIARRVLQSIFQSFENAGLYVTIRGDLSGWVELMKNSPATTIVNPAFDPEVCDIDESNSFWIDVTTEDDEVIACIASKHLMTPDFTTLIETSQLWLGNTAKDAPMMPLLLPGDFPSIAGSVQFYGGLWVRPDFRKVGLSAALPQLARSTAVVRFQPDWHCGFVFGGLGKKQLPLKSYGYAHLQKCTECFFPVTGAEESLYLPYESADEWAESSLNRLGAGVLPGDNKFVDLVAVGG